MGTLEIHPATREDVPAVIDLIYRRPPCCWMKSLSTESLSVFLNYAAVESRAVLTLARAGGERTPAGYAFAIPDPAAFWLGFALENPLLFHLPSRSAATLSAIRRSSERISPNASSATAIEFFPGQFET